MGRGRGLHRPAQGSDACRLCGETGHWAKDCPKRPPGNQAVTGKVSSHAVNLVHVMAEIQGKPIRCLLDSGCGRSVIGRSCVPIAKLNPSTFELFTANKAPLRVIGDLDIAFTVDDHFMEASFSVSPDIEELLLGSDWLIRNQCRWNFAAGTIKVGDLELKAHKKSSVDTSRRVVVAE